MNKPSTQFKINKRNLAQLGTTIPITLQSVPCHPEGIISSHNPIIHKELG